MAWNGYKLTVYYSCHCLAKEISKAELSVATGLAKMINAHHRMQVNQWIIFQSKKMHLVQQKVQNVQKHNILSLFISISQGNDAFLL